LFSASVPGMRVVVALVAMCGLAAADTRFDPFSSMHGQPPKPAGYSGLGAESVSAETVARYAAPPLDARLSRRIQALLDLRGIAAIASSSRGA